MKLNKATKQIIALFNENRLLILKNLFDCQETLCGCDLIGKIGIKKNLLSYHINWLEKTGLIEEMRCGKNKQYRIKSERKEKVAQILSVAELIGRKGNNDETR